jgi:hypothetical protein
MLVYRSAYSSTMKKETICYSETSVKFEWITRRYIRKVVLFITTATRIINPTYTTRFSLFWFRNNVFLFLQIKVVRLRPTPKLEHHVLDLRTLVTGWPPTYNPRRRIPFSLPSKTARVTVEICWPSFRSSVVGWGTMLQAGRSSVRVSDEVDFFNLPNPSTRTLAVRSTQPLTEMSIRNLLGGKRLSERKADNLTAICEQTV